MSSSFSFTEWYKLNGKRLNRQRKLRYHSDPNYRDRVLGTNQVSRERRKSTSDVKRTPRVRPEHRWKAVNGVVEGRSEVLYTIGALSEVLGCSIQALRLWERQGIIPKTPVRAGKNKKGDRLYTRDMFDTIREVLTAQGRLPIKSESESEERSEPRQLRRWVRLKKKGVVQIRLMLIGVLAKAVNRNVVTLEQLEARGVLPRTPFRVSSVGRRLYTEQMIAVVKKAFDDHGGGIHGEEAWSDFHDEVLRGWTAQGVMGAVLLEAAPRKKQVTADGVSKKEPAFNAGAAADTQH